MFSLNNSKPVWRTIMGAVGGGLLTAALALSGTALAGDYDTDNWGGKFRYGAFSTLISSHVMGTEFPGLVADLSDPDQAVDDLAPQIEAFQERYNSLGDKEIAKILKYAAKDKTLSIYEEERSIVSTKEQNDAFIQGMADHPGLRPVDRLIQNDAFRSDNFQFSAHRALYNNAYGIPQNSLGAIVNAYVAGIRNIEFDVLTAADGTSVLIHDLVTNRLNGDYDAPPIFLEDRNFYDIDRTSVDVLSPLDDEVHVEITGATLTSTARVLAFVNRLMPEMTLYLDARNDAPLAIIRLLHDYPEYRDNVVLKIYPFSLNGGRTDLVQRYANQYTGGVTAAAIREISEVNPHVLLALGHVEMEANQDAALSGTDNFDWAAFQAARVALPFARGSQYAFNNFNNETVFSDDELAEIEMRTFLSFRWAMGLTGITNTLVFQMGALPSLVEIIRSNDSAEYALMGAEPDKKYKISAAVHDNFVALFSLVKLRLLDVQVAVTDTDVIDLSRVVQKIKFGISDRFPDFSIAHRVDGPGDVVDPVGMLDFNYSMLGTAGRNQGYQAEKVRSTASIMARIAELEKITDTQVIYATTDLATDLRLAFMDLLGTNDLPADLKYRAGGIIKERMGVTPDDYVLPDWVTRLNGRLHRAHGDQFGADYGEISGLVRTLAEKQQILYSLRKTRYNGAPLTDQKTWAYLGIQDVVLLNGLDEDDLDNRMGVLDREIIELTQQIEEKRQAFRKAYSVRFIKERGMEEY